MTLTILSKYPKWIQAYVQASMKQEAEKLGFDPWGDIFSKNMNGSVWSVKSKAWLHDDDANSKLKVKQQQIQKSEVQVHSNLSAHLQCAYAKQIQHKHGSNSKRCIARSKARAGDQGMFCARPVDW